MLRTMTWWDSAGKQYQREVDLTEVDLVNGRITFVETSVKNSATVRLRRTESGMYHSHLSAGQTPQDWASYVGSVSALGTILIGRWRRDDGAYGGGGKFELPL